MWTVELLIAQRFSDPKIIDAVVSRLRATGAPALATDYEITLIDQKKNRVDEWFYFLPESVRDAIHWTANKVETGFESGRDFLVHAFNMSMSAADGLTGAIMGALAIIIIYLVLRSIYRRLVRYRLKNSNKNTTNMTGSAAEQRPLYRETLTKTGAVGAETSSREYAQSYGTTPPVSRGYYGAGAGPSRR